MQRLTISLLVLLVFGGAALVSAQTLQDLLKEREDDEFSATPFPQTKIPSFGEEEELLRERMELPLAMPERELKLILDKTIDPDEYIVGPGDQIDMYIWGEFDHRYEVKINPEGSVLIPTVGLIDISDLSLTRAKRKISEEVKRRYSAVDVSIVLSNLRTFRVFISGEVLNPGSYPAWAVDRVSDVIARAGGFADQIPEEKLQEIRRDFALLSTVESSRRSILIRRQDGTEAPVDLQRFFRTGDLQWNPYVRMGDVIHVPVKTSEVSVYGAVNLEGRQEFREGDDLRTLVELAGGLKDGARLKEVEIFRFDEDGKARLRIDVDLRSAFGSGMTDIQLAATTDDPELPGEILPEGAGGDTPLKMDDQVFIRFFPEWHVKSTIIVEGAVQYPGRYVIEAGKTRLSELIKEVGGFTESAFLHEAKIIRRKFRASPDLEFERLSKLVAARAYEAMTDEERAYYKTKSREERGALAVSFAKLFEESDLAHDVLLEHGDFIFVPEQTRTINITGQVRKPGLVDFVSGEGLDFYIAKAGGYSLEAQKSRVRVIKGDSGLWIKPEDAGTLEPGDAIWVPEKPSRNWGLVFRETMELLGDIAIVVTAVRSLVP